MIPTGDSFLSWQCVNCVHDNVNDGVVCGGCGFPGPVLIDQQAAESLQTGKLLPFLPFIAATRVEGTITAGPRNAVQSPPASAASPATIGAQIDAAMAHLGASPQLTDAERAAALAEFQASGCRCDGEHLADCPIRQRFEGGLHHSPVAQPPAKPADARSLGGLDQHVPLRRRADPPPPFRTPAASLAPMPPPFVDELAPVVREIQQAAWAHDVERMSAGWVGFWKLLERRAPKGRS